MNEPPKKQRMHLDDRMYDPDHPPRHHEKSAYFRRHFRRFGPMGMGPEMMRRDNFYKDIKDLFILSALEDNPEGLSGSQIQVINQLPRGNLLRSLEELEKKEFIRGEQTVIKGKPQKLYKITPHGQEFLEQLKETSAQRNMVFDDIAPIEDYGMLFRPGPPRLRFLDFLHEASNKEEIVDLLRGYRGRLAGHQKHLQNRLENLFQQKSQLDSLIQNIESSNQPIEDIRKSIFDELKKYGPIPR